VKEKVRQNAPDPPFGVAVGWSLVRTLAAQIRALGAFEGGNGRGRWST